MGSVSSSFRRFVPSAAVLGLVAPLAFAALAPAQNADTTCSNVSPSSSFCVGAQKLADTAAAECRRIGRPPSDCGVPLSHKVAGQIAKNYERSWLHQAAAFQYLLGDPLPFRRAQWLGTHNSFNSVNGSPTASSSDSNQQLSLVQQLEIDMRSLELDLHWIKSPNAGGGNAVVVCHGRGPDQANFGCSNERTLAQVLPEIANWLSAHRSEVLLLYLEDELGDPAGYAETVRELNALLRRPDGSTLVYRPRKSQIGAKGCTNLPLKISRNDVRRNGTQVVLVGDCQRGWASDVWSWDSVHVESGSTPRYRAFPACDATYPRRIYNSKMVRYFEDSTYVSSAVDPTQTPAEAQADALTPDKVSAMSRCGVHLFGFDQILPDDGRIAASIWSWAEGKPSPSDGTCAVQRPDGRWATRHCSANRRAACRKGSSWKLTPHAVRYNRAWRACDATGGRFDLPRTGYENSLLRQKAGKQSVWVRYRLP